MKNIITAFSFAFVLGIFSTNLSAQCNSVVKEGIKKIAPYTYNNQVNNAKIQAGKSAIFHLSFYRGVNYKLNVGSEQGVGTVNYRILDENGKEVFDSSKNNNTDTYSFYSNSSQELTVEIKATDASKAGCVAVVIGMQVPQATNSGRDL